MGRVSDLAGRRFGRLVAIEPTVARWNRKIVWSCRCDCGRLKDVRSSHLVDGAISSCGCLSRDLPRANRTHGLSRHRVYKVWRTMIQRCTSRASAKWLDYGGRGIDVCAQWVGIGGFERFMADMGMPPTAHHTIERRNNNLGYGPTNCEWIPAAKQARNKRNNRHVTHNGVRKLLLEWAEDIGLPYKLLHRRIVSRGWSTDRAFSTPRPGGKR